MDVFDVSAGAVDPNPVVIVHRVVQTVVEWSDFLRYPRAPEGCRLTDKAGFHQVRE